MRFSRAESSLGFCLRRKYSFLRRRWRRRRERLSAGVGEVGRRKSGLCWTRSVKRALAWSGECARQRRVCAICSLGVVMLMCGSMYVC